MPNPSECPQCRPTPFCASSFTSIYLCLNWILQHGSMGIFDLLCVICLLLQVMQSQAWMLAKCRSQLYVHALIPISCQDWFWFSAKVSLTVCGKFCHWEVSIIPLGGACLSAYQWAYEALTFWLLSSTQVSRHQYIKLSMCPESKGFLKGVCPYASHKGWRIQVSKIRVPLWRTQGMMQLSQIWK